MLIVADTSYQATSTSTLYDRAYKYQYTSARRSSRLSENVSFTLYEQLPNATERPTVVIKTAARINTSSTTVRRRQSRARRDEREVHRHVILGIQPLKGLLEERGLIRGAVGRV